MTIEKVSENRYRRMWGKKEQYRSLVFVCAILIGFLVIETLAYAGII